MVTTEKQNDDKDLKNVVCIRNCEGQIVSLVNEKSFHQRLIKHEQPQRLCSCSRKIIYYIITDNTALLSEYPHESHLNHPLQFYIKHCSDTQGN